MLQCVYQMKDWARKPIMTCEFCVHKLPVWQSSLWQRPFWWGESRAQNDGTERGCSVCGQNKRALQVTSLQALLPVWTCGWHLVFVVDIASSLVAAWLYDKFRNFIVLFSLNTGKGFCDVVTVEYGWKYPWTMAGTCAILVTLFWNWTA